LGFCAVQEGRCFRKGRILFIGPAENHRLGFLKGEFLDQLDRCPRWLKTKFFCREPEIYYCKTGKRVTKEEMLDWTLDRGIDEGDEFYSKNPGEWSNNIFNGKPSEDVAFSLQRYEIIRKSDVQIIWRTYAGPNTLNGGTCSILEDILFITSGQNEQYTLKKRQFLDDLQRLPKWNHTKYYCPRLSLYDCKTENRVQEKREKRHIELMATDKHNTSNNHKNSTPHSVHRRQFAFFPSRFQESHSTETSAALRHSGIWKWIIFVIFIIILICSLSFVFLIGFKKEHHGTRHLKKTENSFIYDGSGLPNPSTAVQS
jgi:hypothetical protein